MWFFYWIGGLCVLVGYRSKPQFSWNISFTELYISPLILPLYVLWLSFFEFVSTWQWWRIHKAYFLPKPEFLLSISCIQLPLWFDPNLQVNYQVDDLLSSVTLSKPKSQLSLVQLIFKYLFRMPGSLRWYRKQSFTLRTYSQGFLSCICKSKSIPGNLHAVISTQLFMEFSGYLWHMWCSLKFHITHICD